MRPIESVSAASRVITVTSAEECERAITAAICDGASAVQVIRNGGSTWVYSQRTLEALIAQRKAKKKRWWWSRSPPG